MKHPGRWRDDVWGITYLYFLGWKDKHYSTYLLKRWNFVDHNEGFVGSYRPATFNSVMYGLIWTSKKTDLSTLVHECGHAASRTLDHRHYKFDVNNFEPYTYLSEAIFREGLKHTGLPLKKLGIL